MQGNAKGKMSHKGKCKSNAKFEVRNPNKRLIFLNLYSVNEFFLQRMKLLI